MILTQYTYGVLRNLTLSCCLQIFILLIALSETQTSLSVLFNEQNMVFKEIFLVWFRKDSTRLVLLQPQLYFCGYLRYLKHTVTDFSTLHKDLLSNKSSNKHKITKMCELLELRWKYLFFRKLLKKQNKTVTEWEIQMFADLWKRLFDFLHQVYRFLTRGIKCYLSMFSGRMQGCRHNGVINANLLRPE